MRQLAAAIVLVVATWSGGAAQEVVPPPKGLPAGERIIVQPAPQPVVVEGAPVDSGFAAERRGPLRNLSNRHGHCCGDDPAIPGCGNCHEDLHFIFGSCRSFFGEPCLPKPTRPRLTDRPGGGGFGGQPGCDR